MRVKDVMTSNIICIGAEEPVLKAARLMLQNRISGVPVLDKEGVRNAAVQAAICDDVAQFLDRLGWRIRRAILCPILGGDGNREFFIEAERG